MTPLRRRTLAFLRAKGYAGSTIKSYIHHLQSFALHFGKCPSLLGESHVIEYLSYLIEHKQLSKSTLNTAYSAIKILFTNVLDKPWDSTKIPRAKRAKTLPIILSVSEVERLFDVTTNNKHKAILMLLYSSGLRLGELCQLEKRDVLFNRQLVFVRKGKGGKDRYTVLSQRTVEQLKIYLKYYRPDKWLFPGQAASKPIAPTTVKAIYVKAKSKAGINIQGGLHQLRHSFATHMIETGMPVHQLQKLLGHSSIKTTMVYVHLSNDYLDDFKHPMDQRVLD